MKEKDLLEQLFNIQKEAEQKLEEVSRVYKLIENWDNIHVSPERRVVLLEKCIKIIKQK